MSASWEAWEEHHGTLFALVSDGEKKVLRAWSHLLHQRGWTAAQAREASDYLVLNDPPIARALHPAALERCLVALRQKAKAAEIVRNEDFRGTCVDCRGTGMVSVPQLRSDPLARDTWYTMLVTCHCALGNWKHKNCSTEVHCFGLSGKARGILSLAEYEAQNSEWRRQMRDHDDYLRQEAAAACLAQHLDKALGLIHLRQRKAKEAGGHGQEKTEVPCSSV